MPSSQLPLALAHRHNRQQICFDHNPNVTLPQRPERQLLIYAAGTAQAAIALIASTLLHAPIRNKLTASERTRQSFSPS